MSKIWPSNFRFSNLEFLTFGSLNLVLKFIRQILVLNNKILRLRATRQNAALFKWAIVMQKEIFALILGFSCTYSKYLKMCALYIVIMLFLAEMILVRVFPIFLALSVVESFSCVDKSNFCFEMAAHGMCYRQPSKYMRLCPLSCGLW
jgi:hypothetical protein